MKYRVFAVLISWLIASFPAHAQQSLGSIEGTVRDPSGAVVVGATVTVRDTATNRELTAASNEGGLYTFPELDIGTYLVTVTMQGFEKTQVTGVRVVSARTTTADVKLRLGQTTQVVDVTGAAPVVDTATTAKGNTRTLEEISELPIAITGAPRDPLQFMRTLPGVTVNLAYGGSGNDSNNTDIIMSERSVIDGAGQGTEASSYTNYNIDGVSASGSMRQQLRDDSGPVPESIAEFRLSSNLNAEYGWNQGTALELVTKSGTNRFHGEAWELLRNNKLDSRYFFAAAVTPRQQNEFGGAFGGPIIKNKVFLFATYDGYRLHQVPAGVTASVPTSLMHVGNFSEWLGPQIGTDTLNRPIYQGEIYDPSTTRSNGAGGFIRDPYDYNGVLNAINPTVFSALSKAFDLFPLPTLSGVQNNWVGNSSAAPFEVDKWTVKGDYQWGGKNKISVGWQKLQRDDETYGSPFDPRISQTYLVDAYQYHGQFNYSRVLRPNLLFAFRAGGTRNPRDIGQYGLPSATFGCASGMVNVYSCEVATTTISGDSPIGGPFLRIHDPGTTIPIYLDLDWVHGDHNYKFGIQYDRIIEQRIVNQDGSGAYSFGPNETGLPGYPLTGVGFASYLIGAVDSGTMKFFTPEKNTSYTWSFYAQDAWHATKKLTVNYGLRYDIYVPTQETYRRTSSFDPTEPNPGAGGLLGALSFYGHGPGRNGMDRYTQTDYADLGPRLGLAYAFNPKTVGRAYYGISYVPTNSDLMVYGQPPSDGWGATLTQTSPDNGVTPASYWDTLKGWPTALPTLPDLNPSLDNGGAIQYINPRLDGHTPMVQSLGAAVERQLPGNISVKAEYVGKLNHHLMIEGGQPDKWLNPKYNALGFLLDQNINSAAAAAPNQFFPNGVPIPYPGFNGSVMQALEPYPQYTSIGGVDAHDYNSFYHSFQLTAQKRFGQGLNVFFGYTISKNLFSARNVNPDYPNIHVIQGLDRPQQVTLSYNYDLPFGPGKRFLGNMTNPVVKQLVGGWAFIGNQAYMGGLAVSVSADTTGLPIRTNQSCSGYDPNNPAETFLNIKAFTATPVFTYPDANQLGSLRTCGYSTENLSLRKRFPIHEKITVDVAAEAFNAFNRHAWQSDSFQTNVTIPQSFGRYNAASDPREISMHARITF